MKKKILLLSLIIALVFNCLGVYAKDNKNFSDVPEKFWANDSISHLVDKGILNGFPDNSFKPNFNIGIDAFIKMTVTSLGHTEVKNGSIYWATNYIKKAIELKLIEKGQFFNYKKPINREQMASIIINAIKNEDKADTRDLVEESVKDFGNVSYRYKEDVKDAYALGILTGFPDGSFQPGSYSTRAQASVIIHRMLDKSQRKPFEPSLTDNDSAGNDSTNDSSIGTGKNDNSDIDENINTSIEYIHKIENGEIVYSTEKIMKLLKSYPIVENFYGNDFYDNNKRTTDTEEERKDWGALSIETERFIETFFTRNNDTLNKENELKKLLWWFQSWWVYRNDEYAPKDFVQLWLDETEKWKVKQDMIFVTDSYRMVYQFDDGKAVRGRMYFRFSNHDNIDNIKYEFELPEAMNNQFDSLKFDKWYYVDVDVLMCNPASNAPVTWSTAKYMLHSYNYLSDIKLVEGQ
ncbi:S-layer homology domain-containing protein [Vallitalea guaymasensis]|uniref:S-layer homology domain-containing protein n=1 Tax=Vallitalea guaymasensis TaxID=1185412 RepID=UPI000DE55087|nr:S-layer homology domain-containing protein [Vallitalea guaymasensis]